MTSLCCCSAFAFITNHWCSQESPIILRDGNGTIYPMAKDCMGGIRDPDWLDLPPIASLGIGVHSLANLPNNSTIKKKAAVIIMAVEVHATL